MSKYLEHEDHAAELLMWLDNGAPHSTFSLSVSIQHTRVMDTDDLAEAAVDENFCGTVCCIAGAAQMMANGTFGAKGAGMGHNYWSDVAAIAVEWLGIQVHALPAQYEPSWGLDLFSPDAAEQALGYHPSAAQAAQAVRNFIRCGDPCWKETAGV